MFDTRGALEQIADALTAGGVNAFIDPRDNDLPGVWVQRQTLALAVLGDCATLRIRLLMVAPDIGTYDALAELDALEAGCLELLPPNTSGPTTDRGDVLLPDDVTLFPGRFYDVDLQISAEPDPAPDPAPDPLPEPSTGE